MTRFLLPALLALAIGVTSAPTTAAQDMAEGLDLSDPALAGTARQLNGDARTVTHMVATAALAHRAGGFPDTPFGLLGSAAAGRTGLRAVPLSDLTVARDGDRLVLTYVPLPTDPYVREDRVVRLVVTADGGGRYTGAYAVQRRADPDLGGRDLVYDRVGRFVVHDASGTACVDLAVVDLQLAAGRFDPEPGTLSDETLTVTVRPVGGETPVYYRATADGLSAVGQ